MPEVTCVGNLVADVVGTPIELLPERGRLMLVDRIELHTGGCAANTGMALARLGVETALLGKVGRDGLGDFVIARCAQAGIDTTGIRRDDTAPTSAAMVLGHADGERSFLYSAGASATFRLEEVDREKIRASRVLHIAGALLLPALDGEPTAQLLQEAKLAGILTSLDTGWDDTGRWLTAIGPCLPYVDYLLPGFAEAQQLAGGRTEPHDVAQFLLDAGAKVVGLKMGEQGAFFRTQAGEQFQVPALPVRAVDGTGAGDAFVGGFLAGVVRGWELEECARLGAATGAACVMCVGATTGLRDFEETVALQARYAGTGESLDT